jgi:hypothetical protein
MVPFFMFLRKSLDFSTHNVYFQVSVKIAVSYEPECIDNVPECFIVEPLCDVYITWFCATPQLDTVCPNGF